MFISFCVSHSVYISYMCILLLIYMSPSMYVSHSVCIQLCIYPTPCVSHFIFPTQCIPLPLRISHFVSIPLQVYPTQCIFIPCISYSVSHSMYIPICVSYSVYIPLYNCPTPWKSYFYISLCLYSTLYITPCVSHPVCSTLCILLRVCPTLYVFHFMYVPLYICPTSYESDSIFISVCMFFIMWISFYVYSTFMYFYIQLCLYSTPYLTLYSISCVSNFVVYLIISLCICFNSYLGTPWLYAQLLDCMLNSLYVLLLAYSTPYIFYSFLYALSFEWPTKDEC